jgi:hypothetical protein
MAKFGAHCFAAVTVEWQHLRPPIVTPFYSLIS